MGGTVREDVAVIGLGLRFPGDATSPEALWDVLRRKESQWSEFPRDRLNIDGYYHPSGRRQGGISFRGAHFLKEDVAAFDATFFSIPSEEAAAIDPQQRMLLEVSYEALENAGIRKEDVDGGDCAVYVGSFVKDYEQICLRDPDWSPQYAATGNGIAIMANRISYALNLHGPSMTIDTGCSGSLIAVHLASQTLRTGESSLAIAAGAGMILSPNTIMPMTALNFLSPDGKCFTFDARANGYGRGEGIGAVILKRLSDALRDNDTIHAVIRSSSTNQDGRTTGESHGPPMHPPGETSHFAAALTLALGITLPSKEAQVANIRNAYATADLDFGQTAYVECHGTGTQAGDWRELKAISETIGAGRPADKPVVVGSVKPNIGHLEGAAGIAGLIKGVLTLRHGQIPPQINFVKENPEIDFEQWGVKVPTETLDWPLPGIRRVSVNCFGFGGSNAHVIMDEAPGYLSARGLKGNHASPVEDHAPIDASSNSSSTSLQLFLYSANDKGGVSRVMISHLGLLKSAAQSDTSPHFLKNYAYTLAARRSNLDWKGFIVADTAASLVDEINRYDLELAARSSPEKKPKIGFLFCGQGAQWAQMGKDLMSYGIFSASLQAASTYLKDKLGSPFSIIDEIFMKPGNSRIACPEVAQPATTALQVALVDLLSSFDILPRHVVGHSSGEIAAAYAAGALTREAAWKVAYYRGLAAASIPVRAPKLRGGMVVVGMSVEKTETYLTYVAKSARVACINSPRSVTVSGQEDAIHWIAKDLESKGIFSKVLDVKTAYHSSHMKLVEYDYKDSLGILPTYRTHKDVKMFSSVTGKLAAGTELNAEYWTRNLVSPVQFVAATEAMMSLPPGDRPDILVEISPSAALRSPTADILSTKSAHAAPKYLSVLERKQTGPQSILNLLGELWAQGCTINLKFGETNVDGDFIAPKCLSNLPSYPWNHSQRYWSETHLSRANRYRKYPRQDLIGSPTADSVPQEPRWRGFLRISESPWIQDHQIQKTIIYPAAGMVSMVLEGAKQLAAEAAETMSADLLGYEISDFVIDKAILIPDTAHGLEVALNIRISDDSQQSGAEFAIYSKPLDRPWERHATGTLRFRYKASNWQVGFRYHEVNQEILEKICTEDLLPRQLYEDIDAVGINYGSSFRNLVEVRKGNGASVGKIRIPDTRSRMPEKFEYPHLIHPVTLDAMLHTLLAIELVPMVPVAFKSLFVSANIDAEAGNIFNGHSTTSMKGIRDAEATIVMRQPHRDHAYVIIDGLRLARLSTASSQKAGGFIANHHNLAAQIVWKEDAAFASPASFLGQVDMLAHKYPSLTVLQVGPSRALILETLAVVAPVGEKTPRLARYTIVVAAGEEDVAEQVVSLVRGTSTETFVETVDDISKIQASYHLIIARDDLKEDAVKSLEEHLAPGGVLLKLSGCNSDGDCELAIIESHKKELAPSSKPLSGDDAVVLLTPSETNVEVDGFIAVLGGFQGATASTKKPPFQIATTSIDEILTNPDVVQGKIVVSLLDFNGSNTVFDWRQRDFDFFRSLQDKARAILWITRGAQMRAKNPRASPIIGLARTLMSEDPLKTIATLDLDTDSNLLERSVVEIFLSVFNTIFNTKPGSSPREVEYAERAGKLYIPRLTTIPWLNQIIEKDGNSSLGEVIQQRFHSEAGSGLRLAIPQLGMDKLCFNKFESADLRDEDVEIALTEAPLSFLDVETMLGRSSDSFIGLDVIGKVKRVGDSVSHVAPGDEVWAIVADGAIQNFSQVKARFVKRRPSLPGLAPSYLISAYYALFHVGRLCRGRKALIHAGASAFGLAAIDLALAVKAEVFTTVVGSDPDSLETQRDVLVKCGIPEDHIFDAKSGNFVGALKAATDGKGLDVIYDPTLEHLEANFRVVRICGSIIQFANKYPAPVKAARASWSSSMTVVNFDLRQLLEEEPDFVGELFDGAVGITNAMPSIEKPFVKFKIGGLRDALLHIQQTPLMGLTSVVAELDDSEITVPVLSSSNTATKTLEECLDPEGTYLLSGGLGGLGKSISELLVKNGVRHLAYLSRSGASSASAAPFLKSLQDRGVDARVYAVDICDAVALQNVVVNRLASEMAPIRGVFQCAAVIRDAVFDNMTFENWDAAIKPKTVGSWNLVQATGQSDPFYVFLASSSGVIGNRGQANYASGNCFEDSLAQHLRLQGRHAVSIDLGPVLGAGMLTENDGLLDILRASGFYGIRHKDFLKAMEHAITSVPRLPPQVILGVGTGGLIHQNKPADPYWSRTALYSHLSRVDMPIEELGLSGNDSGGKMDIKSMLAVAADVEAASAIVCAGLSNMLAKSINMLPEEIDVCRPPRNYGVDSLVAVGVRNWVLSNCGVQISVFELLGDATIAETSREIANKGGYGRS